VTENHHRGLIVHQMIGFEKAVAKDVLSIIPELFLVALPANVMQDAPGMIAGPLIER
jgi:hypothetical protein